MTARDRERRTFIKGLAAAGGLAALASAGLTQAGQQAARAGAAVALPDVPWRRRVFCQFDPAAHGELLVALRACAVEVGLGIVFGENGSADLYAIGGFVLILDRDAVGAAEWNQYVRMYGDDGDATPCFIVDGRKDLPLPRAWSYARQFDKAEPASVPTIVEAIRQMKLEMNRRLPDLFRSGGRS